MSAPTLPPGARHRYRPRPPSASMRIAQSPAWERCSERYVEQNLLLTFRRAAAVIAVLAEMGLEARAAELVTMVTDAAGPREVLPLGEALYHAERSDAEEQVGEADLRRALETGTLAPDLVRRYITASARESHYAERCRQSARQWLAEQSA